MLTSMNDLLMIIWSLFWSWTKIFLACNSCIFWTHKETWKEIQKENSVRIFTELLGVEEEKSHILQTKYDLNKLVVHMLLLGWLANSPESEVIPERSTVVESSSKNFAAYSSQSVGKPIMKWLTTCKSEKQNIDSMIDANMLFNKWNAMCNHTLVGMPSVNKYTKMGYITRTSIAMTWSYVNDSSISSGIDTIFSEFNSLMLEK